MTGNEDFLTASLSHGNLQVDTSDPGPRPMIAVLDARPGLADALSERIVELVRQVRREPGCATFTAYEARDTPGRLYDHESAAAFGFVVCLSRLRVAGSVIPDLNEQPLGVGKQAHGDYVGLIG